MLCETAEQARSISDGSFGSFRWESELVSMVEKSWSPWPGAGRSTWLTLREVRAGTVLADVVFIRRQVRHWPRVPESLSPTEAVCLSWLRTRPSTQIDWLERLCGLQAGALRHGALIRLREHGVIEFGRAGRVTLKRDCSAAIQIVAVEAKLSNWKKALSQARTNRSFADRSYVALPFSRRSLLPRLEGAFRDSGVGLFFVARDACHEALPASSPARHTWRREYVYSAAYASLKSR
ncbi:MAG: hypothetical protein JW940_25580 [Polyangiaceae bacterium]|nr:hypothetical protein [Polyangiaceae bacterium]